MAVLRLTMLATVLWLIGNPSVQAEVLQVTKRDVPGEQLFNGSSVPLFEIHLDKSALAMLSESNRTYVRGTVKEGSRVLKDVGIRLKGRGTYQPLDRKPSFTIKFNEYSKQTYLGLTKIMLNNSVADNSFLREYLANQLFRDAGLPAPRVTHARVKLNGRDLGLYVVVEGITKGFLSRHFSRSNGNLYEGAMQDINARLEQDGGTDKSGADVKALIDATQMNEPAERWQRLSQILDVNRFVSFLAMEQLVGQIDGYAGQANNYRIYHDPDSRRMVFFPHGLDTALSDERFTLVPPFNQVLSKAVLQTHQGRHVYRQALERLFTNVLSSPVLTNRAADAAARLQRVAGSGEEVVRIESNCFALVGIIRQRTSNIAEQIAIPGPKPVQFDSRGVAAISGWKSLVQESAEVDQLVVDGKPTLHISSSKQFITASFRTLVLLEPGKYILAGEIRTRSIEPWKTPHLGPESVFRPHRPDGGVILFTAANAPLKFLKGDSDWREHAHEFEIKYGPQEVELVCELRASKGEVWFNRESLRLIRK